MNNFCCFPNSNGIRITFSKEVVKQAVKFGHLEIIKWLNTKIKKFSLSDTVVHSVTFNQEAIFDWIVLIYKNDVGGKGSRKGRIEYGMQMNADVINKSTLKEKCYTFLSNINKKK